MWEEAGDVGRVVPSGERDAGRVLGHSCPPGHRQGTGPLLVPRSQPFSWTFRPAPCGSFLFLLFNPLPWWEGSYLSCHILGTVNSVTVLSPYCSRCSVR